MAILGELEEELPLMASVSNMPDVPWNEMSLCSRHMHSEKNGLFAPEKLNIGLFQRAKSTIIRFISISSCGPTPVQQFTVHDPSSINDQFKVAVG